MKVQFEINEILGLYNYSQQPRGEDYLMLGYENHMNPLIENCLKQMKVSFKCEDDLEEDSVLFFIPRQEAMDAGIEFIDNGGVDGIPDPRFQSTSDTPRFYLTNNKVWKRAEADSYFKDKISYTNLLILKDHLSDPKKAPRIGAIQEQDGILFMQIDGVMTSVSNKAN